MKITLQLSICEYEDIFKKIIQLLMKALHLSNC